MVKTLPFNSGAMGLKTGWGVRDFPCGSVGKEPCNGFDSWVGKIPWRRAWQPTPVFLPDESHGQRSLAGYSP